MRVYSREGVLLGDCDLFNIETITDPDETADPPAEGAATLGDADEDSAAAQDDSN